MSDTTLIGVSRPRIDAPDKVTGATRFAADGYVHGLLHARPVLATEAHARIRGVDKDAALATPGVVAVLARSRPADRDDGHRPHGRAARAGGSRLRRPAGRARRRRRPKRRRRTARRRVVVDYEPLAAVVDVEAAMEPGAALARIVEETEEEGGDLESIHAGVDHGQEDDPREELSGNVLDRITRERRGRDGRLAASDAVVEGTFRTPWVYQAYLEPQVCTAWLEPSGTLVVSTSTQGSFVTRQRARARLRPPARAHPRDRGAARRRVRRQVRARRAARSGRGARAAAAGAARPHALGGLPGDESRPPRR